MCIRDSPIKLIYIYKGQEEKVPQTPPEITNGGGFGEDQKKVDTLELSLIHI